MKFKEKYFLNSTCHKELNNMHLITTHHGAWIALNNEEYEQFKNREFDKNQELLKKLVNEKILITQENIKELVKDYKKRYRHLYEGSVLHIISPTLRCTNKCIYCHAKSVNMDKKEYDMEEETALATLKFIFQSPSSRLTIEFQGGEPLVVFPIVKFIVENAKKRAIEMKKQVSFVLVTNLALMDKEKLNFLIKNNVNICTSLDGPKKVHDENRRYEDGKGSYDDVVKWIKVIKNEYKYDISALVTFNRFTLKHWKEVIDEYIKQGFKTIRIRGLNNAGFASERWNTVGYTPEEFVEAWKKAVDYVLELNKKGTFFIEGMTQLIAKRILMKEKDGYTCFGAPCGAALTQSAYNFNGDVYACDEARSFDVFKLGNVKEHTYKQIYTSSQAMNIIGLSCNESSFCNKCAYHAYCAPCLVSTYGQQGNLISKLPEDIEHRIREEMVEHVFKKIIFDAEARNIITGWIKSDKRA